MQRKLVTAIIVLLACGVVFGAVRYSRRSPSVPTIEVKRTEFLDSVQFRGECTALKSLSITAPADAGDLQILKIAADGAKVKPGDMIVEFDKTKTEQDLAQFRSTLKYSTADIDQTRAQSRITEEQDLTAVSKARFDLESAKLDAGKQEIVSKIEGEEAKLKVRNAEQTLREAEQKLNSDRAAAKASIQGKVETSRKAAFDVQRAETALSKMTLKAPAAGMVSLVPVWHGGNVSPFKPGDRAWPGTPLAELPDPGSIRVTAHVDETERGRLAPKQPVTVHLDAIPDRQFTGRIEDISALATEDFSAGWPVPRDFDVRIVLDDSDPRLKPGMTAQVTVIVDRVRDALAIPVQASFQKEGETLAYVWSGSKFRPQAIEISRRSGDRVLVAKGLQAGDRIALQDPAAGKSE
ncbi:MAG TPA: efflux RND transporter periplasmic adaptor subunit [Terriglobales bacterium]|jgi:HlyD family secretion protein|nr:efflux RND transporter periplasmic adaptor subunit [Terriglobales bacterium]